MGRKPPRNETPGKQPPAPQPESSKRGAGMLGKWFVIGIAVVVAVLVGKFLAQPRHPKVEVSVAPSPPPARSPLPLGPIIQPEVETYAQYAGSESCKAC